MKSFFSFLHPIFALFFALAIVAKSEVNNSGVHVHNVQASCLLDSIAQSQLDVLVNSTNAVTAIFRVQDQKVSPHLENLKSLLLAVKEQLNLIDSQCSQATVQSIAIKVGNMADAIQSATSQNIESLRTIWSPILTKITTFYTEVRNAKLKALTDYASISQKALDILATRTNTVTAMLHVQDQETTLTSPDFFNRVIDVESQLSFINSQLPAQNIYILYMSVKEMANKAYSGRKLSTQYFLDIWNPILDKIVSFQAEVHKAKREVLAAIHQGNIDVLATRMDAVTAMLHVKDQDAVLDAPQLSNYLTQLQSHLISINSECAAANLLTVAQNIGEMAAKAQSRESLTIQYFRDKWNPLLTEMVTFQANVANAKVEEARVNPGITALFQAVLVTT